jgi:hypothetical protein
MRFSSFVSLASVRGLFHATSVSVLTLAAFATTSAAVGCGRTDLEDSLVLVDAGADVTTDTGTDAKVPDAPQEATPFDVIIPPPFDAPIDSPVDAPFDASSCGDGTCDNGETCTSCALDCGFCPACGDGTCNPGETCSSCPQDCGSCPVTCGNGFCDNGETCLSCPGDCGVCAACGDGTCNDTGTGTENCTNCPSDCGQCTGCGDGHCAFTETCVSCPSDCGSCAFCGNGKCEASEGETCDTCAKDCGACTVAKTCEQILTCAFACFQGGIGGLSLSCLADCDANACTQAQGFADQATDCLVQSFLNGTCSAGGGGGGGALQCAEQACASQIASCLGSAPCPGSTP